MVSHVNNVLEFSFPEVSPDAYCAVEFIKTLRIPDDNREYPLPPGLGSFLLHHVEDYPQTTPDIWQQRGGVFLPIYQAEALWIKFHGTYPCAIKIAAGKINAVSGETWDLGLKAELQDYVVVPAQPWLDGFCVSKGLIRQFVAMPLGDGFTAEEQLTGKADVGGLQICVYPMKKEVHQKLFPPVEDSGIRFSLKNCTVKEAAMGFAPGGLMRQEIFKDKYGFDAWDTQTTSRCFVHLANSEQYLAITGHIPPEEPPTAKQYNDRGLPWFEYYATDEVALHGAKTLAELDSIGAKMIKFGKRIFKWNEPIHNHHYIGFLREKGRVVATGR